MKKVGLLSAADGLRAPHPDRPARLLRIRRSGRSGPEDGERRWSVLERAGVRWSARPPAASRPCRSSGRGTPRRERKRMSEGGGGQASGSGSTCRSGIWTGEAGRGAVHPAPIQPSSPAGRRGGGPQRALGLPVGPRRPRPRQCDQPREPLRHLCHQQPGRFQNVDFHTKVYPSLNQIPSQNFRIIGGGRIWLI